MPAEGGISGAPLKPRALAVLRRLRARTEGRLTLIAVGGIETADDAWERIRAGATLVQAYTGFIYGGPLWPRRLNAGSPPVRAAASPPSDAIGADAPRAPGQRPASASPATATRHRLPSPAMTTDVSDLAPAEAAARLRGGRLADRRRAHRPRSAPTA